MALLWQLPACCGCRPAGQHAGLPLQPHPVYRRRGMLLPSPLSSDIITLGDVVIFGAALLRDIGWCLLCGYGVID